MEFIQKIVLYVSNQSLKKTVFDISIHCLLLSASIAPAAQPTGCGFGSFEYEMLLTSLQCRMGKNLLQRNLDNRNIPTSQHRSCEMTTGVVKVTLSIKLEVEFGQNINFLPCVFCQLPMKSAWLQPVVWRKRVCEGKRINNQTFLVCWHFPWVNIQPWHISLHVVLLGQESLFLNSLAGAGCRTLQRWERSYRSPATVLPWLHTKSVFLCSQFSSLLSPLAWAVRHLLC